MRLLHCKRAACSALAVFVVGSVASAATLTKVDIYPPDISTVYGTIPTPGTYVLGSGDAFTMTGDGLGYYPGINFTDGTNQVLVKQTGDVLTFAYEKITGDFDRRVRVTGVTNELSPNDVWTRGGLMVRTSTNCWSATFDLTVANPNTNTLGGTVGAAADQVRFSGRALDGQAYWDLGRDYGGVHNVIPNQWIRLRRVGDTFLAYVGTTGTNWALISQRFQEWPATLLVGPYAGSQTWGTVAKVHYATYGATPQNDTTPPLLVSAGTLDKKFVGVKFSKPVDSATATVAANYQLSQGTITEVKMGIGADAVYLTVSGLTADTFTVKVIGGVKDTAGNLIAPNSQVAARALNWNAIDIGNIQHPSPRVPTPGDDPYRVGKSVMVSSDENPEVEVVGGGSNQWNPGDYVHYIYRTTPLSGNFDVTIAVSRFDRSVRQGGYSNAGLMLRVSPYLPGLENTVAGSKVPMVANTTYIEASGPGRGAIPLWRTDNGGGYGNGNAGFSWATVIGGVKGYFNDLRATDSSGAIDPVSAPDTARYLRIKRVGTQYTFYASWNRIDWALVQSAVDLPQLPDQLLLGFSVMTDSGAFDPPLGAYSDNGHMLDLNDPLNCLVPSAINTFATGDNNPGRSFMNESCYAACKIKIFPNGVPDPLPTALTEVDIRPQDDYPPVPALSGSWASEGTHSFNMTGGGTGLWRNLGGTKDGTIGGDELSFAYETITGDFDKQVNIKSLSNVVYMPDGSVLDTNLLSAPVPVDAWARAGLMVRSGTNSYNQCLKIFAGNPAGGNSVIVAGRAIDAQDYIAYSPNLAGVSNALPNQWLRMKRVGNAFSCYVSKDGVVWSLVTQRYLEMTNTVFFGPYCAASLNNLDTAGNPDMLISRAFASFASYQDVNTGDVVPPTLVSAGTLDKKTVGVKFSEPVSSVTGTIAANYSLSQGTVTAARIGIGGDSVYLTVSGLSANTFTVAVTNVTDTSGNKIVGKPSVQAKVTGLVATDIGLIQNPGARPTVGDDPYRTMQAVPTSSDDAPEVEVVGGGSNAWNPGDFFGYVHSATRLTGNFDVSAKISRYDHSGRGGYSHSGLMLRADVYNAGEEYTVAGSQVPMVANTTYFNLRDGPGRAAIPLWRTDIHGGYGNGNAGFGWPTIINGIKGYYPGINPTDSVGTPDPLSSAYEAHWVRIVRSGTDYTFYASWDGIVWALVDGPTSLPTLPDSLLLGFSTMNDSGSSAAPNSAYGGNGHTIDPADPLNPSNAGGNVQNESNFTVTKMRLYNTASIGAIAASKAGTNMVITYAGTLVSASSLKGPWSTVQQQGSPYTFAPPASGSMYYRVLP